MTARRRKHEAQKGVSGRAIRSIINPEFSFMRRRKTWYAISLTLIVVGLLSLAFRGLNFGIEFAGGSALQVRYEEAVAVAQVREVLAEYDLANAQVQKLGEGDEETIRIKARSLPEGERREALFASLAELGEYKTIGLDEVMPEIGSELQRQSLFALAVASAAMVVYITLRFEFRFAVAAIAALLHDVLIALGFFSLLWIEIDSAFVAAILTIIGYSINDTIVVFDRIRENLKYRRTSAVEPVVDASIHQTLVRSVNTSLTTFLAVAALYVFGGTTLKDFTLALLVGVVVGTYSSIFVASPLWFSLHQRSKAGTVARV